MMDTIAILKLTEEIIKDYEKSETHAILFYSKNQPRDFNLLARKVKKYRTGLEKLLAKNESSSTQETGDNLRERNLQGELL